MGKVSIHDHHYITLGTLNTIKNSPAKALLMSVISFHVLKLTSHRISVIGPIIDNNYLIGEVLQSLTDVRKQPLDIVPFVVRWDHH